MLLVKTRRNAASDDFKKGGVTSMLLNITTLYSAKYIICQLMQSASYCNSLSFLWNQDIQLMRKENRAAECQDYCYVKILNQSASI